MKTLDKYVAKNFLIGYAISFGVLIGLRIIIDLFVNLDEFTEHADLGSLDVLANIFVFYGLNTTLYFRDFAGMITVVAATFSLAKMVRSHELVAVMASGVSLKRVTGPIFTLAVLLTGLLVIDQEFIIPPLSDKLVRSQDAIPGQELYDVWFMSDENGSLVCAPQFTVGTATLSHPTIITRKPTGTTGMWEVTGHITATKATYNHQAQQWDLTEGFSTKKASNAAPVPIKSYKSDLSPKEIPVRRKSRHKSLLSSHQLATLAAQGPKIKDLAQLHSQKHFRITDPIINLVMLMICLPILVCRDPKAMKSAVMISFSTTAVCFVTTFVSKMLATEVIFSRLIPQFWAWLPVFIFLPIAVIELDSMKT
jgi:lipopolysaccharide export system permease protein